MMSHHTAHVFSGQVICLAITTLFLCCGDAGGQTSVDSKALADRERGIQLFHQEDFQRAVEALEKAVKSNKQDYDSWYFLGLSQLRTKDLKDSTRSFETALKLKPNSAGAQVGLAYSLLLRNKLSDALREANVALTLDSANAEAHYIAGVVQLRTGRETDALAQAETAAKINPEYAVAYLLKSEALAKLASSTVIDDDREGTKDQRTQRYREAEAALSEYLRRAPDGPFKETWKEQLETLRLMTNNFPEGDPRRITASKDVTTKVRVLAKPEPAYTELARQHGVSGTIVLRCVFMADGTVKHLFVVSGLPDGLTEQAIEAARRIKFIPATKDGKPVSMWMELQYNFNTY